MDPLQIILIVLAAVAVWAVVELALSLRRARSTMDGVDKVVAEASDAVGEINETLAEAKPVIAKLDDTLEELQPAIQRVEPLLVSANVAVDALSANLVEVEAVVRDVASFTDTAVSAKNAARNVAGSASDAVQRILGRKKSAADPDRALAEGAAAAPADGTASDASDDPSAASARYYTYDGASAPEAAKESHE